MAISGAVESRIIELERQIEWERKEKEELRAKYVSNLEEMERKHQKKIKEMKKEMQQLRLQLKESNKRVRVLEGGLGEMKKLHQDEMNDLRKEMNKMVARERRKQHRLLCGSVGYNYIRAASTLRLLFPPRSTRHLFLTPTPSTTRTHVRDTVEYVFHNRHDLDQLMERLHSIEGIRAEMGEADEARWREFERTYYSPMYDDVLRRLTRDRVDIAHPTTEDDDEDSEVVAPKRMQEIIADVYKQKDNRSLRDSAVKLVHSLDILRRALGREDLLE